MVQLDVIFARASLAMDMNATEPIFNDEGRIRLKQARHPLIDKKKAVPIDIRLGDDFDLLLSPVRTPVVNCIFKDCRTSHSHGPVWSSYSHTGPLRACTV